MHEKERGGLYGAGVRSEMLCRSHGIGIAGRLTDVHVFSYGEMNTAGRYAGFFTVHVSFLTL